jgi:hypothetical protein
MSEQLALEMNLKRKGKAQAASHNNFSLVLARKFAAKFCDEKQGADKYRKALERFPEYPPERAITAEDVREGIQLIAVKRYATEWRDRYTNNFMGQVFNNGEYINTRLQWINGAKGQHARAVSIWVKK